MALFDDLPAPNRVDAGPTPVAPTPPSERGIWRSAFDTENDVVALGKVIEQQSFPDDLDFNLYEYGKEDPLFREHANEFLTVGSAKEYEFVKAKLLSSMASRGTLERAGFSGWMASMAAGIASPTMLIPGGSVAQGLSAGVRAARLGTQSAVAGGISVALQESMLQAAPNDRAAMESVINVGLGTVLAGGLGAGLGAIAGRGLSEAGEHPRVNVGEEDLYVPNAAPTAVGGEITVRPIDEGETDSFYIYHQGNKVGEYFDGDVTFYGDAEPFAGFEEAVHAHFRTGSVGAGQVDEVEVETVDPTGVNAAKIGAEGDINLEGTLGLGNTVGKISPTVRGWTNPYSNTVRDLMRRLSNGGLLFKKPDGSYAADADVETRAKSWEGLYYKGKAVTQDAIRKYHMENQRAADRLSEREIMEMAADAIDGGLDNYQGPEVVKTVARAFQNNVFKPFAEEVKRLEFNGHEHWRDPNTYVPHMVKKSLVASDHEEFVGVLTEYFGETIAASTTKKIETLKRRTAAREQEASDLTKTEDEAAVLRGELAQLEKQINESITPDASEEVVSRAKKRLAGIKRRKTRLNQTKFELQKKIDAKEETIRRAEAQNLLTVNRLVTKASRALEEIQAAQGKKVTAKELNELEEQITQLGKTIDDFVEKNPDYAALAREATTRDGKMLSGGLINNVAQTNVNNFPTPKLLRQKRSVLRGKITRGEKKGEDVSLLREEEGILSTRIEGLERDLQVVKDHSKDIPLFRIVDGVDEALQRRLKAALLTLNEVRLGTISRRALRIKKLQDQRDAFDPDAPARRAAELREKIDTDTKLLYDKLREQGIEISGGQFNVASLARKQAEAIAAKMTGEVGRIPLTSTIFERGPELERTLNIDPLRTWSNGRRYADFMERNLDVLSRIYTRTVGADVEVFREFGSLNPMGRTGENNGILERLQEDFANARAEAIERTKHDDKEKRRTLKKIADARRIAQRDIQAVVDRIRHVRGIPEDPASIPWRAGRAILNINTLRLMGGVVVSSAPDPIRIMMKNGMRSTFRDGLGTLINNMKAIKPLRTEAKYYGVGLDLLTHGRLAAMADVFEDYAPGTKFERGLQYATNNMGRIALFDYWNSFWKQASGVVTMQRAVHDIQTLVSGRGDVVGAERFLAHAGMDEDMAYRVWEQLTNVPGGAANHKGVLVPNVAEWTDKEAARAFRTAILRVVDDTIITPGVERPLLFDGSMMGRMIFQFRSFAYSSLIKTMMHGAQELKRGNLNILAGSAISVGLGMMGWWTWANLAGEKQRKKMQSADLDQWLDEGIARSGLLGPIQEAINIGQKIPGVRTTLSEEGIVRNYTPFRDPFLNSLGPTVGFVEDLQTIAGTASDPKEATLNAAVRLAPFHNLFYARPLINATKEEALGM